MSKYLNPNLLYWLGIIVLAVLGFSWYQHNPSKINIENVISATATTSQLFSGVTAATTTATINGYTIQYIARTFDSSVRVFKGDKVVFQTKDDSLDYSPLLSQAEQEQAYKDILSNTTSTTYDSFSDAKNLIKRGARKVLTNGAYVLAITGNSGSADSCTYDENYIIELSSPLKILWQQEGCASFIDSIKNGALEIGFTDSTFLFWDTDNVDSPRPEVILSLQGSEYKPDPTLMHKSAPSLAEIKSNATSWTADEWILGTCSSDRCSMPWEYALDLIYSGNVQAAKTYLDLAWRPNERFSSEKEFISQFTDQLKQSPYYDAVLTINGGKIF